MGSRQDLTPQEPVMVRRQRRGRASTAPTIGPLLHLHQNLVVYVV